MKIRTLNLSGPQVNPVEFFRNNDENDIVFRLNTFVRIFLDKNFSKKEIEELYKTEGEQYYTKRFSVLRKKLYFNIDNYEDYSKKWDIYLESIFDKTPEYKDMLEKAEKKKSKNFHLLQ